MVRKSTINDLTSILYIYEQINVKYMVDDVKNTKDDFISYINNGIINVYDDGVIKGFVLFFNHVTWGYIELICVNMKYRGCGIGELLVNSVKNDNWNQVETCCFIDDDSTINVFKKYKFKRSNQITDWYYKIL